LDGLVGDPRWQGQLRQCYASSRWGVASQVNVTGKQLIAIVDKFPAPGDGGEFHHYHGFATLDASLFILVGAQAKFYLSTTNVFNRIGQECYGIVVPNSINDALGRRFTASLNIAI